ncbi:hypothetical protein [Flavobacterium limi]|uniref:Uncharacterized protein n=1 Tax=Flavobacterium limi TaxID=2045105 RepID=A0ABQ1TLS2_9FLAO|nr:hypothetical protein [Flavobacterium limi]GGE98241.1 hypothetical protein GCM10011518_04580 [Flavobacterium limi]
MLRILQKEKILADETIHKTEFEQQWYFSLEDIAEYLQEDLSEVEYLELPLLIGGQRKTVKTATFEAIEKGRKKEELSDFNKALLKARHFKK